jgi:hypothetical protein
MRSSTAVGLLLTSSLSIFGIYARQTNNPALAAGPEPVWVNGQMGVYSPETGEFVPSDSPLFDQTCDEIQARRNAGADGNFYPTTAPSQYGASHSGSSYYYGNHYGSSSGWYGGSSASRSDSIRGGIGETGHGFGGSHS